ncbi:MAG: FAD-dependent oxidoreductase, partial [Alphaproteobacteria bacterium]|nr:FAD-dependent oxidoreductase [Alphaproteobacteria bacterium]
MDVREKPPQLVDCDVVVVGSGAAGLSAALAAAVDGARVIVLEKSAYIGGTTAMSAAGTWVPCNHHMKAAGIEDSPEETLTYIRAVSPPGWQETEDELWRALAEQSGPMLRFLEDKTPLRFELVNHPDFYVEAPGGRLHGRMVSPTLISRYRLGLWWNRVRKSVKPQFFTYKEMINGVLKDPWRAVLKLGPSLVWRVIAGQVGLGNGLTVGLVRGCLDHGCRIVLQAEVRKLTIDGGAVTGVEALLKGRQTLIRAAKGVVLATGGFDWAPGYMPAYFPTIELIGAPRTNTGDGQRMASEVGAELAHMDQANIAPATFTRYEGKRHAQPLYETYVPHCILVNREGKRFVSEGSAALGEAIDQRGPDGKPIHLPAWRIFDSRYVNRLSAMYAAKEPGFIRTAPTIEALAAEIGLDPATLKTTVERFNGWSKEGVDRDFHRGETAWERYYTKAKDGSNRALDTVEQPPFHAAPFIYASLGTKGGPRTNERCEVL